MDEIGLAGQFALDVNAPRRGIADGKRGDAEALRQAAQRFEAMFLEKMMSSMREAYLKSDLGRGPQTDFYESLMDKQWAQHVAGHGLGLAEQLVNQLGAAESYKAQAASADTHSTKREDGLR